MARPLSPHPLHSRIPILIQDDHWFYAGKMVTPRHSNPDGSPKHTYRRQRNGDYVRTKRPHAPTPQAICYLGRMQSPGAALYREAFPDKPIPPNGILRACNAASVHPVTGTPVRCCNPHHAAIQLRKPPKAARHTEPDLDPISDELAELMIEFTYDQLAPDAAAFRRYYIDTGDYTPQQLTQAFTLARPRLTPDWQTIIETALG